VRRLYAIRNQAPKLLGLLGVNGSTRLLILLIGFAPLVWLVTSLLVKRRLDITPLVFLKAPWNALSFRLRRWIRFEGRPVRLAHEPKEGLFDYLPERARSLAEARETQLCARYSLGPLRDRSTRRVYRDNLYVLDVLDRFAAHWEPDGGPLRALDVGSMDFRYAFGLERWLERLAGPAGATLTGLELDVDVLYRDLTTRRGHGLAHARVAGEQVSYVESNFLEYRAGEQDVIFFWFPFVLRYALVRWGLPKELFDPEAMLAHAHSLLKPGGLLVIVNHTEEELHAQVSLLARHGGFALVSEVEARSDLVDYREQTQERHMLIITKEQHELSGQRTMLLPPVCEVALEKIPKLKPLLATKTRVDGRSTRLERRNSQTA
jgi:SAM-dependent methyltransferase